MFTFISELVNLAVNKKDLTDELARAGVESEQLMAGVKERLEKAFEVLLKRAQAVGAVRDDINRTDVTALVMGTCMAASQHGCSGSTQRLISVLCDGFRARANSPSCDKTSKYLTLLPRAIGEKNGPISRVDAEGGMTSTKSFRARKRFGERPSFAPYCP